METKGGEVINIKDIKFDSNRKKYKTYYSYPHHGIWEVVKCNEDEVIYLSLYFSNDNWKIKIFNAEKLLDLGDINGK